MSNNPTLDDWLTKQQAAQILGVAEKTVDRMSEKGELQKGKRKRPGKPPVVVFHPGDVDRAKADRQVSTFVVPSGVQQVSDIAVRPQSDLSRILEVFASRTTDGHLSELSIKVYLTIDEARKLTGLSADSIQRLARGGKVGKIGRLYRRKDLEEL